MKCNILFSCITYSIHNVFTVVMYKINVLAPLLFSIETHRMVLRIRADDPDANCPLGAKFGCSTAEGKLLLNVAKSCGLNVIGIRCVYLCIFVIIIATV